MYLVYHLSILNHTVYVCLSVIIWAISVVYSMYTDTYKMPLISMFGSLTP